MKPWWIRGLLAASLCLVSFESSAQKGVDIKTKDFRPAQLAELGKVGSQARVLVTFKVPGAKGLHSIACARSPKADSMPQCATLDPSGAILDASVGLNVLRTKAKGKDILQLLFRYEIKREYYLVSVDAPLALETIDAIQGGLACDLSMIEFMSPEDAFPIGVPLDSGVRSVGNKLVFGDAGSVDVSALLGELSTVPAPLFAAPAPAAAGEAAATGAAAPASPKAP